MRRELFEEVVMQRPRFLALFALLALAPCAGAAQISGDYVETRSADVWTGPCFANAEVGLVGKEAILAWRVNQGSWNGVDLNGLSVVAVVRANATLGDPFASPYPAKALMIVDEKATPEQRTALVGFARQTAGELLSNVVGTEVSAIHLDIQRENGHPSQARLDAGVVGVETRSLAERDRHCGNEETYYPPLTPTSHAMPVVATLDRFNGTDLGVSWTSHERRSAFVGSFSLASQVASR